jgi:hypothetical protein
VFVTSHRYGFGSGEAVVVACITFDGSVVDEHHRRQLGDVMPSSHGHHFGLGVSRTVILAMARGRRPMMLAGANALYRVQGDS